MAIAEYIPSSVKAAKSSLKRLFAGTYVRKLFMHGSGNGDVI